MENTAGNSCFQDILNNELYLEADGVFPVPFGTDHNGEIVIRDLADIPYLFVGGSDFYEKTYFCQSILTAALTQENSDLIRLIICDTNVSQYSVFSGVSNLYLPIITDPRRMCDTIGCTRVEARRRYKLFSEIGVRDITQYNTKMTDKRLPHIFLVVDDFDVLLNDYKDTVEIIKLLMIDCRSTGIHLILVSSAKIEKTKKFYLGFPTKVCFYINNSAFFHALLEDKMIPLLQFESPYFYLKERGNNSKVKYERITDEEMACLLEPRKNSQDAFCFQDNPFSSIYNMFFADRYEAPKETDNLFPGYDEWLPLAVDIILDTKQASVSMLQRRLKLGYSRAARLLDQMEELGIVGPFVGSMPRQLLITREQWQAMQREGNESEGEILEERDIIDNSAIISEEAEQESEEVQASVNKRQNFFQKLFGMKS